MDLIQRPRRLRGSETVKKNGKRDKNGQIFPYLSVICKGGNRDRGRNPVHGRAVPLQCRPSSIMNWNVCRMQV